MIGAGACRESRAVLRAIRLDPFARTCRHGFDSSFEKREWVEVMSGEH